MRWQLPECFDAMAVNAALMILTERWDERSANTLVYAFHGLPKASPRLYDVTTWRQGPGDRADIRLVDLADDGRTACVGKYRVRRFIRGAISALEFRCPVDDEPDGVPSPMWHIFYTSSRLSVLTFIRSTFVPAPVPWHMRAYDRFESLLLGRRTVKLTAWKPVRVHLFVSPNCTIS